MLLSRLRTRSNKDNHLYDIGLKRINHIHKNATLSNSALSFFAKANELQIKIHAENNVSSNVWNTICF